MHATQLIALGLAVTITAVTAAFLRYTGLGTAMRSLANDREITAMLGVPVRRVEAAAWLGSGVVCGAGALLLASLVRLDANALTFFVISALAAAVVGRLRSLWVTLAAGLVIGLVEAILTPFDSISPYRSMTPFVFAIVALLWFGRRRIVTLAEPTLTPSRTSVLPLFPALGDRARTVLRVSLVGAVLLFCLLALPELTSTYWIKVFTAIAIFSITALGLGLLYGRVGMISLCQVSLLAIGGWITLRIGYGTGLPFPLVLVIARDHHRDHRGGRRPDRAAAERSLPRPRDPDVRGGRLDRPPGDRASRTAEAASSAGRPQAQARELRRPDIATGSASYMRYCIIVALILFVLAYLHLEPQAGSFLGGHPPK